MIKLKTDRTYTFPIPGEIEASVTFKFKFSEDKDYSQTSNIMREVIQKNKRVIDNDKSNKKVREKELIKEVESKVAASYQNTAYTTLRKCLIECIGFENEEGKPIVIIKEGKVNELAQKVVFEYVKSIPELYEKVELAQDGVQIKN